MDENYLGSEAHLAHLGSKYAEVGMAREVPEPWAGTHDEAFYAAYDAYRHPGFLMLLEVPEEASYAADAIGEDRVSRYCQWMAQESYEFDGNADIGESVALVELTDVDRITLTLLAAMDAGKAYGWPGEMDWSTVEPNYAEEGYAEDNWAVVLGNSQGFTFASFYETEDEARTAYAEEAKRFWEDKDE